MTVSERWIPIAERLPKDGQDILVFREDEQRIVPTNYDRGSWFDCVYDRTLDVETISHWMPLPEPPETARGEGDSNE